MEVIDYKEAKISPYTARIVYFGAIYASGVTGLKKIVANMRSDQELYVATVGMADPEGKVYIDTIRKALKEQIPPQLYDENKIFRLRGAIDYSSLDFKHRMVKSMLHSKMSKMPEEELSTVVNYVKYNTLKPL